MRRLKRQSSFIGGELLREDKAAQKSTVFAFVLEASSKQIWGESEK